MAKRLSRQHQKLLDLVREHGRRQPLSPDGEIFLTSELAGFGPPRNVRRGRKVWQFPKLYVKVPPHLKALIREAAKARQFPGGEAGVVEHLLQFLHDRPALFLEALGSRPNDDQRSAAGRGEHRMGDGGSNSQRGAAA